MEHPRLTVIVATTGRRASLEAGLQSIRRSLDCANLESELLVVHNSRMPSEELQKLSVDIDAAYLHEPELGLSVARNRGVLEAKSEVVAFVDDDIIVRQDWAGRLIAHFRKSDIEVVTGLVLPSARGNAVGLEWYALYGIRRNTAMVFHESTGIPFFPLTVGVCGSGNNMAFRRDFLLRYGLFDPRFGLGSFLPGGEELDRFYSVLRRGKKILFAPDVCAEQIYEGDIAALRKKIRGYATAQVGLLMKWFYDDPPMRTLILRYLVSRIGAVLKRKGTPDKSGKPAAPRSDIILGSLRGPFAYLLTIFYKRVWIKKGIPTRLK